MADQPLIDYIKKATEAGQTAGQIKNALYKNGWTEIDVNDAFTMVNPLPPSTTNQPKFEDQVKVADQLQPQYQPQTIKNNIDSSINTFSYPKSHILIVSLIVLVVLMVSGGAFAFVMFYNNSTKVVAPISQNVVPPSAMQPVTPPATPPAVQPWCHTFNTNLGYANSGSDEVVDLHTALQKENIPYSPDGDKDYTKATGDAVLAFQIKYKLAQSGFVGTKTRVKLNELYGCPTTPTSNQTQNSQTLPAK